MLLVVIIAELSFYSIWTLSFLDMVDQDAITRRHLKSVQNKLPRAAVWVITNAMFSLKNKWLMYILKSCIWINWKGNNKGSKIVKFRECTFFSKSQIKLWEESTHFFFYIKHQVKKGKYFKREADDTKLTFIIHKWKKNWQHLGKKKDDKQVHKQLARDISCNSCTFKCDIMVSLPLFVYYVFKLELLYVAVSN